MINWVLSLMVLRPKGLTEEEAEGLAKVLPLTTHPTNYKEAQKIMTKLLRDIEKS